jgi:hypothetical protein
MAVNMGLVEGGYERYTADNAFVRAYYKPVPPSTEQ